MDVIEGFVKELNEEVKTQCAKAFVCGNHAKAVMFLPCIQEPEKLGYPQSLLRRAAVCGWTDVAEELITKYGFNPAYLDPNRSMPVHEAARYGHIDVVRLLTKVFKSPPQ